MRRTLALLLIAAACEGPRGEPAGVETKAEALTQAPPLSPTRLLRRVHLTLRGTEPSVTQYEAAQSAVTAGTCDAYLSSEIDAALASTDLDTGVVTRDPRSADIVTTALAVLGVNGVRISGGNGEILGVRKGT